MGVEEILPPFFMSSNYPFNVGPIAGERNPPINPQYYSANFAIPQSITPITQSSTRVITTEPNEFVVGQLVRFTVPPGDGMYQIDEMVAYIITIENPTTFYVQLDSTRFDPFYGTGNPMQIPQVIPVGDASSGQINSSGRINNLLYPFGAFINVSPK